MRSETLTVRQIFQDRRQYRVPFYQRSYVWNEADQWRPLWEDIRAKAESRIAGSAITPHFLGAAVIEPQHRTGLRGVETFHIIDGQQRLTTLQYAIAALLIALRESKIPDLNAALGECLRNGNPETMLHPEIEQYKVWPTFRDQSNYTLALAALDLQALRAAFPKDFTQHGTLRKIGIGHPRSLAAIWYFAEEFITFINRNDPEATVAERGEAVALAILQDLKLVLISLEEGDDAQIIFETLNGRGATLHATDLIRNFIFMKTDGLQAQRLYDEYWTQFETTVWASPERRGRILKPKLEWMIHASVEAETRSEVDLSRLYASYKRYATKGELVTPAETQLETLDQYSEHYKSLSTGIGDLPVARFGRRITAFDVTTVYPLALLISTSSLSDEEKAQMFDDLVSYIVRRAVCKLGTKNYNNVFMSMLRSFSPSEPTPEALRRYMSGLKGGNSKWPSDVEFKSACKTAPLYPGNLESPARVRQFLTEVEAVLRSSRSEERDVPNLANLDIEHIMPRSWYQYWPLPDGTKASGSDVSYAKIAELNGSITPRQREILQRDAFIPTLGNLTLLHLSVNREAQNREFALKREKLIASSNLSLNVPLMQLQEWNPAEIEKRAARLADAAIKVYPGPEELELTPA